MSPFAEGKNDIFIKPILKIIAAKYKKSPAQVILRWFVDLNIPFAVKSVNRERIKHNLDIFDFKLSKDDIQEIKKMDTNTSCFLGNETHNTPECVERLHKFTMQIRNNQEKG